MGEALLEFQRVQSADCRRDKGIPRETGLHGAYALRNLPDQRGIDVILPQGIVCHAFSIRPLAPRALSLPPCLWGD